MRSSTFRDLLILISIGVALFAGGYFIVKEIGKADLDLSYEVSIEQEEKLGDLFKDMIWGSVSGHERQCCRFCTPANYRAAYSCT